MFFFSNTMRASRMFDFLARRVKSAACADGVRTEGHVLGTRTNEHASGVRTENVHGLSLIIIGTSYLNNRYLKIIMLLI